MQKVVGASPIIRLLCESPGNGAFCCLSCQELPAAVVDDDDVVEAGAAAEVGELLVRVEMTTACDGLRGGGGSAQLRAGRVHREPPSRAQDAQAFVEYCERIV